MSSNHELCCVHDKRKEGTKTELQIFRGKLLIGAKTDNCTEYIENNFSAKFAGNKE